MAATADLLPRFQRLFRGRENMHGKTRLTTDDTKLSSWVEFKPAVKQDWVNHLRGSGVGLGIGCSTLDNTCYFGVIDLDDDSTDHAALAQLIAMADLPLVTCRSKSGGAHLILFMKDPAPAALVIKKLREWQQALYLKNPEPAQTNGKQKKAHAVEVFPKNAKLAHDDPGNWINLPYYHADKTTRYAVTADGQRLSFADFLQHAEDMSVSSLELESIQASGSPFQDGPPCLQILHQEGYPEGSRNQGMYNVGIFFKLSDPEHYHEKMREYNEQRMDPPLKDRELEAVIRSLEKRDYVYKCEEVPIQPHCHKAQCKKQRFGISGFRRLKNEANMPAMSGLKKVMTDPPRWQLMVEGQELEFQTEELMLIPRFRKRILEQCSRIFPLIRQGDWDDVLSKLLEDHEVVEAPEDAGTRGHFRFLVGEFLLRRLQATSREDLLSGMPIEEGPRVYFRSSDLLAFLDRKKFRDYDANQIYTELRKLGAGHARMNVKGAGLQLWFMPTPQNEQQEEFTPKSDEEPKF